MTLDDRLRGRLAEIRAAAGVPHAQISLEVLYFLPKGFLDAYADLFTRALKADGGESARNNSQQQAGDLGKARGAGAKPAKKRWKKAFVVQDEKALALKTRIDKRLRGVAADIAEELVFLHQGGTPAAGQGAKQCDNCRAFIQKTWKFCAMCGEGCGS